MEAKITSVYLNEREQAALKRLERELGQSQSGVLRIALRLLAAEPIPSRIIERHRAQTLTTAS